MADNGDSTPYRGTKALITGASGFIGSRLRSRLLNQGCDVIAIRRPASPKAKTGRSVEAAYDDLDGLIDVMRREQPDYIFHVAGATKGVTYDDFRAANVIPTKNLLEALREAQCSPERFLMVSSLAAYGPSQPGKPLTESDAREPVEFYGRSKLEAERVVEEEQTIPWTIIRPSGVYGPGDGDYFNLFREIDRGRNVYFGNKDRWFSAVYVDDCIDGILAAALSSQTTGRGYFLCDGNPITWGMFQEAIISAADRKVWSFNLPEFFVDVAALGGEVLTRIDRKPRLFNRQKAIMGAQPAWTCRHDAAKEDFGYTPQVQMNEGVAKALKWYRTEGWL